VDDRHLSNITKLKKEYHCIKPAAVKIRNVPKSCQNKNKIMNQFLTGSMGIMFFKFCNIKNLKIVSPKEINSK
jgi:hypothetical protein